MTTWGELKADVRAELKDINEASYRWSEDQLFVFFKDALSDYSMWFPRRVDSTELELNEGGTAYVLPSDYIDALYVECPANRFLEKRRQRPGRRYPSQAGRPFYYYVEGGALYLLGTPQASDAVLLTYEALHAVPLIAEGEGAGDPDEDAELTVPERDMELMRLYIEAKCYEQLRSRQSALDRFKERYQSGASRQDNPLTPEVRNLMDEYLAKVALRLGGGSVQLYRPGRPR